MGVCTIGDGGGATSRFGILEGCAADGDDLDRVSGLNGEDRISGVDGADECYTASG